MAENCCKCKKSISKETEVICNYDDCHRKYHRACVNVDDEMYEAMQRNPLIAFSCDVCKQFTRKQLNDKINSLEEKLNNLCFNVYQIQANLYQPYHQVGCLSSTTITTNGDDLSILGSRSSSNLIVVGNNCNSDRLQVVCDYGRWVQIGKFATNTTEEDIVEHLADELKINKHLIKCSKLVKNTINLSQLSYCKFKISIPDYRFNELFNEAIWPSGVMVSPFTPRTQQHQYRL